MMCRLTGDKDTTANPPPTPPSHYKAVTAFGAEPQTQQAPNAARQTCTGFEYGTTFEQWFFGDSPNNLTSQHKQHIHKTSNIEDKLTERTDLQRT